MFFPRQEIAASLPRPVENDEEILKGSETILLVEDEPSVLVLSSRMLEHMGYRLIQAGSPMEAIHLAKTSPDPIDLLMTDVIMPQMNGWDLATALQPIQPGMKRLFTSGHAATSISQPHMLNGNVHFIQKPFTMQALSRMIRKALQT